MAAFVAVAQSQKTTVTVENETPMPSAEARRVALVVQNHCAPTAGVPMMALTDALVAKLSGSGFNVINPNNVIGAIQNRTASGEAMPLASALNVARETGAEGVITASVLEFVNTTIGKPPMLRQYKVRLSLNLADGATGATVCGATVRAESPKYTLAQAAANGASYCNDLIHAAAESCAEQLEKKTVAANWKPGVAKTVNVFFGCNVLGADVQIDGLSYGTCPAQIEVAPGPHNVLVSYPPYYLNFARKAMFTKDGQQYAVVLQITPEGEKVRRSGELFEKQKTLFDAELSRYNKSGDVEDYVRKTIADGTSIYWKNSYGRIVVTDATAENIDFTTPHVDGADLQDAPSTIAVGKKLKELLTEATATVDGNAAPSPAVTPAKSPDSKK